MMLNRPMKAITQPPHFASSPVDQIGRQMHGDERDVEAAGEEAEHEQHVGAVAEGFAERLAERLRPHRIAAALCPCAGVATAKASGSTSSTSTAKTSSVLCQPTLPSSATASGENRNWPNEPAAVPTPNAKERHSSGSSLPNAASTMVKLAPARPKPISTPAERCSMPGVVE